LPATPEDYEKYGYCVYTSKLSGKQYVFVNSKTAQYLQYEVTGSKALSPPPPSLSPSKAARADRSKDAYPTKRTALSSSAKSPTVFGSTALNPVGQMKEHLLIPLTEISMQMLRVLSSSTAKPKMTDSSSSPAGASARTTSTTAAPHGYRVTFTIKQTQDGKIDGATNTDGVTAVGGRLNADFPGGVLVAHDDVNQEPDGSRNPLVAFKIVGLEKSWRASRWGRYRVGSKDVMERETINLFRMQPG